MKLNLEIKKITRITTGVYCGCEVFIIILGMEKIMSTLNFARKYVTMKLFFLFFMNAEIFQHSYEISLLKIKRF